MWLAASSSVTLYDVVIAKNKRKTKSLARLVRGLSTFKRLAEADLEEERL